GDEREFAARQLIFERELLFVPARRRSEQSAAAAPALLLRVVEVVVLALLLLLLGGLGLLCHRGPALLARDNRFSRHVQFELNGAVPFDEANRVDGQMLRIVGNAGGGGEARSQFYRIEDIGLGFLDRVDKIELPTLGVLERVPKAVA